MRGRQRAARGDHSRFFSFAFSSQGRPCQPYIQDPARPPHGPVRERMVNIIIARRLCVPNFCRAPICAFGKRISHYYNGIAATMVVCKPDLVIRQVTLSEGPLKESLEPAPETSTSPHGYNNRLHHEKISPRKLRKGLAEMVFCPVVWRPRQDILSHGVEVRHLIKLPWLNVMLFECYCDATGAFGCHSGGFMIADVVLSYARTFGRGMGNKKAQRR